MDARDDGALTDYWALDAAAKDLAEAGDDTGAALIWERAIGLTTPDRLGAYRHLARHRLRRRQESAALIDEGLALATESTQRRWWLPDLLFLAGVNALLDGETVTAEAWMQRAYGERPSLDEEELLPTWALVQLASASLMDAPCLAYLARFDPLRRVDVDYEAELAALPDDTHVLEVGAMDGVRFDTLFEFITARGWTAVLVEPIADMHAALARNYAAHPRVRCVRAAITEASGEVTMLRVRPESVEAGRLGEWALGVSSLSDSLLRHYPDDVVEERVRAMTFDELVAEEAIDRIDVLQIDTEGHDWQVLRQVDLGRWRPRVVRVEVLHLDPAERLAVLDALEAVGYDIAFSGSDVTAVLRQQP